MKRQSRVGDLTPGYQAHGPDKAKQVVEPLGFGWDFSLHPQDGIICLVAVDA